jgi:uncharacterized protein YndB with AHSA1/START domain
MPTPTDAMAADALEYDVHIAATPELVWRFWTDPDHLVRWMGRIAQLEPRAGGTFRLDYGQGDVASGRVLEADAPRRLVFTWGWENPDDPIQPGGSTVEVSLEPDADGTRLRLRHSGLDAASREGHHEGWQYFLGRLSEAIAAA